MTYIHKVEKLRLSEEQEGICEAWVDRHTELGLEVNICGFLQQSYAPLFRTWEFYPYVSAKPDSVVSFNLFCLKVISKTNATKNCYTL